MVRLINHRSSGLQMFFNMDALKNLVIFTEKDFFWSLFLIKLQAFFLHSDWIRRDTDMKDDHNQFKYGRKASNFVKKRL